MDADFIPPALLLDSAIESVQDVCSTLRTICGNSEAVQTLDGVAYSLNELKAQWAKREVGCTRHHCADSGCLKA